MWRNYMTVGLRALAKNRTYAFINIVGLAIGLAACLMILIYVRYETSFDERLPNAANTYQFQSHFRSKQTGEEQHIQMTPYHAGERLKASFPQVERSVYALSSQPVVIRGGEALSTDDVLLVDNLFFDVLQFPLVQGDPRTALNRPDAAVLTQSEARRIFGTENVLGRTVTMISRGITRDYRITGVARDLPRNSHVRFTIVARIDFPTWFADQPDVPDLLGLLVGLVLFHPSAGHRSANRSRRSCRPGSGATFPTSSSARTPSMPATSRTGKSSTSATSISASLRMRG